MRSRIEGRRSSRFGFYRPFLFPLLGTLSMWALGAPARASVTPNLIRLIDSPAGRHLLFETEAGESLLIRLLGGVPSGDAVGNVLGGLSNPALSGVSMRLEECLSRIEDRAIQIRPDLAWTFQAGERARFSGGAEELLDQLAGAELRVQSSFFPPQPFSGFEATRKILLRALELDLQRGSPLLRYPVGVDPVRYPDAHLDFGLEASYSGSAVDPLLSIYGPESFAGDGASRWFAMGAADRARYVRENASALFPSRRREGALVLLRPVSEAPFLPMRLAMDWDGSLLLQPSRAETLEQWMLRARWLSTKLSPSRAAGSVGAPLRAFHSGASSDEIRRRLAENAGYLFFANDLETLTALEAGTDAFADPAHGPMTASKQRALVAALQAHAAGEPVTEAMIRFVQTDDTSFRVVGGTVYRPDLAPGRIHLESRDCGGTLESLADRVVNTTFFLQFGRESFAAAAGFSAFDPKAGFAALPEEVRGMLERVHPLSVQSGLTYSAEEVEARKVFRNFAWPLRSWETQLRFLGRADLSGSVSSAQRHYWNFLVTLARRNVSGELADAGVRRELTAGLARFARESGLLDAYRAWQAENLRADRGWEQYMALAVRELGPLASAFPLSIWEGGFETRIARFLQRWPRNAAIVDDVGFRFVPAGARAGEFVRSSRRVLVISTQGLGADQVEAISRDYTDAVSRGTISFPLAEAGGHLHARLGNADFDWWGRFTVKPYRASSWRRLEAVVALSPVEELRLRTYIDNVSRNPWGVVGMPNYGGAGSAVTEGGLDRNMPRTWGEGHNCTSYLCTVRVGDQGERLFELAGADAAMEVHTNPGWWTHFLTGAAVEERVPMVVRWDAQSSLSGLLSEIRPGRDFPEWDFALE